MKTVPCIIEEYVFLELKNPCQCTEIHLILLNGYMVVDNALYLFVEMNWHFLWDTFLNKNYFVQYVFFYVIFVNKLLLQTKKRSINEENYFYGGVRTGRVHISF